jgi:hypothetical protein
MEVRIIVDPDADIDVAEGVVRGIDTYLKEIGINADYKLIECDNELKAIEDNLTYSNGQLDVSTYLELLSEEKKDIADGRLNDKRHWDVVITSKDLKPREPEYARSFGSFTGIQNARGKTLEDLASMVISTSCLTDDDPKLAKVRGILMGYHEASHLRRDVHCETEGCIFNAGMGGLDDIDLAALNYLENGEIIPKCAEHNVGNYNTRGRIPQPAFY